MSENLLSSRRHSRGGRSNFAESGGESACHNKGTPNDVYGAKLPRCSWALSDGRSRRYHRDGGRHSYWCDSKLVQFCVVVATACPLQHRADLQIVCSLERRRYLCDQFIA